ncbi:MAG TPA: plastocyanin/azurin family copper-binding protein [Vicinamibacterales bacterium]|nr:plastocyanin/azurin family copper-binding protein [Vicinamibacterales bacterium]
MFLRIFLFGFAVVGVLVAALVWAVVTGQYEAAQPSPSPTAAVSGEPVPSSSPAGSAVESPSAEPSPSAGASGAVTMVEILDSEFGPDITVAVGTTVTWMNTDGFAHTATEGSDGVAAPDALFDLQLAAGASEGYTFTEAGTFQVTCTLHPNMNMTITVE